LFLTSGAALAHPPKFGVYSKYDAVVSGQRLAFVFSFDREALLGFLADQAGRERVEPAEMPSLRGAFSRYFFDRFSVANDGTPCSHPEQLGRFFWDEPLKRALAVTSFTCSAPLGTIVIRALVAHDMPTSHALIGDLQFQGSFVRSLFAGDRTEATIRLAELPTDGEASMPPPIWLHGRLFYVTSAETTQRFQELVRAELGEEITPIARQEPGPFGILMRFVREGILHILTGYDHIAFIVTLMIGLSTWRRLAIIVTSFTLAHSLTLALSTLGIVSLSPRLVEPLIALTVLVVALDALLRPAANVRGMAAFAFGLVHGLGLSSALRGLGLSKREVLPALCGFNLGVEVGQLLIVAPLFVLVLRLRERPVVYGWVRKIACSSVAALAAVWLIVRIRDGLAGYF
jgi:HupE/UreJ protein